MPVFVALLRAVNVGKRKVAMAELRAICEDLGYDDVRTYVNSGNVVFTATGAATGIETAMEKALQQHYGFDVPVVVKSAAQWSKLAKANPFPKESKAQPNMVHAVFSRKPPNAARVAALEERASAGEQVKTAGGAPWIYYPDGSGRSKLGTVKDSPDSPSTSRNFRTVLELEKMLQG
jgi:uncharacterized protein (DUF1697 family)